MLFSCSSHFCSLKDNLNFYKIIEQEIFMVMQQVLANKTS